MKLTLESSSADVLAITELIGTAWQITEKGLSNLDLIEMPATRTGKVTHMRFNDEQATKTVHLDRAWIEAGESIRFSPGHLNLNFPERSAP